MNQSKTVLNTFGEEVYCYTRADALADGALRDITSTAQEAGIKYPTAVTEAVWNFMIDNEERSTEAEIDSKTWDVCFMLTFGIRSGRAKENTCIYPVVRISGGKGEEVFLKSVIHSGDNDEPVITIMLPDED